MVRSLSVPVIEIQVSGNLSNLTSTFIFSAF
jgi:hypothetical protein